MELVSVECLESYKMIAIMLGVSNQSLDWNMEWNGECSQCTYQWYAVPQIP